MGYKYTKQNFKDGKILYAENLNDIENGIEDLANAINNETKNLDKKITEQKNTLTSETQSLKDKDQKLSEDISTIEGDISTIEGDISTIKGDISDIEEDLEKELKEIKNQIPDSTFIIPSFKDIDNSRFKPLIDKCFKTWYEAFKSDLIHYVSLKWELSNDGERYIPACCLNPMLYKEWDDRPEKKDTFGKLVDIYRDIYTEYSKRSPSKTLAEKDKYWEKGSLNCISFANMLMMGVSYENSRLGCHENIIGSMGYGFDICKYLPIDSAKDEDYIKDNNGGKIVKYYTNQTLGIDTFESILTQEKAWDKKENTLGNWGRLGLAKHLAKSSKDINPATTVTYGDIRIGDILADNTHTTFVLDVQEGIDKEGNKKENTTQITYVDINDREKLSDILTVKFDITKETKDGQTTYTISDEALLFDGDERVYTKNPETNQYDKNGTTRNFIKVMRPYYQNYNKIDISKSDYIFQEQSSTEMPLNKTYNGRKVYSYRSSFKMEDIRKQIKDNEYKFELDLKAARVLTFQVLATNKNNIIYPFPFISISGDNMQVIAYARYNRNGTNGTTPDELSFSFISDTALENYEIRYYIEYTK